VLAGAIWAALPTAPSSRTITYYVAADEVTRDYALRAPTGSAARRRVQETTAGADA
jgi:hypothetical protein